MSGFIEQYFINPILENGWFNPVNTIIYSVILIIAVIYVYKLLKRLNIPIDKYFILSTLPFIFWGSSTRVLHDAAFAGVLSPELNSFYISPIFPTPGSYFITFALALSVLLLSLLVQKIRETEYWKVMFSIGIAFDIINIALIPFTNLWVLVLIPAAVSVWVLLFASPRLISSKLFPRRTVTKTINTFLSNENLAIIAAHFLDATATVVALTFFGYVEQHVVPRMLFPYMGAYAMFFLKALVVPPALYVIDRYAEDGDFKNFLKLVVLILGLAPGLRNTLRLAAGV